MILQSLTEYYQALEREGKIAAPGWSPVKVSFALYLGNNGIPEQIISMQTEQPRGKKLVLSPQIISLPVPVKRTVGVEANFLCDNSSYFLGRYSPCRKASNPDPGFCRPAHPGRGEPSRTTGIGQGTPGSRNKAGDRTVPFEYGA